MQLSAQELAKILKGKVVGNPEEIVTAPSRIEDGKKGTISFLAHSKYESYAYSTAASILLVSNDFEPKEELAATMIRVEDVRASVQVLLEKFEQKDKSTGNVDSTAIISENATIGKNVTIHEYAIIRDGAVVGDNVILYPLSYIDENAIVGDFSILHHGAKVLKNCIVGKYCILHQNAVIGGEGFGFAQNDKREFTKIPQIGNVVLEDHVELGINSCIDRATMGSTIMRKGVKIDNLVQVGHNCEIGENTGLAAQVGIAGSAKIGKNCMVGGQVGFAGHISVADGTMIAAQTGVNSDVKEVNSRLCGSPAMDNMKFWRSSTVFKALPELSRTVRRLEKEIAKLKEKNNEV